MSRSAEFPELRSSGFVSHACPVRGLRFFTSGGLFEHRKECLLPEPQKPRVPKRVKERTPEGLAALRKAGATSAERLTTEGRTRLSPTCAKTSRRRRCCDDCGTVYGVGQMGHHLKRTGHTGYTEVQ